MKKHAMETILWLVVLNMCACACRNDSEERIPCSSNCVYGLKYSEVLDKKIYTASLRLHKEYYDNLGKLGDLAYLSNVDQPVTVKLSPPKYDEVRNISANRSHIVYTVLCASAKENKWEIAFSSDGKIRNGLYSPGEAIVEFVYFLDVVGNEAVFYDARINEYFYKPLSEYDIPLYRSFIRGRADAIAETGKRGEDRRGPGSALSLEFKDDAPPADAEPPTPKP